MLYSALCKLFIRDSGNDIFRRILEESRHVKGTLWTYPTCVSFLVMGVAGLCPHHIQAAVTLNSNISLELYRLNDLNIFSFLVHPTLTGLLMTIPLLTQMLTPALKHLLGIRHDLV